MAIDRSNSQLTNITTSGSSTVLITKGTFGDGAIREISVSNNSDNEAKIILDLYDGTTVYYICKMVSMPGNSVLVFDNMKFDGSLYNLRIYNTGTSPDLTVIIK
tara:strand:- start:890 stop:1201 length:312 start_codon:yes stop_codon:yes gene_type:complete